MPLRVFRCPEGHESERLLRMSDGRRAVPCETCGAAAGLILATTWVPPDGVYSYEPNIGKHRDPAA